MRTRVERTNVEKRLRRVADAYGRVLVLVVAALPAGVAAGAADALFGRVLLAVSGVRAGWPLLTVPFLAVAGALTAWAYRRFGKGAERGIGLVFGAAHGQDQQIPLRLVPLVMASTWLTHLTGGSAGREGVAVQIGATLSHWLGRRLPPSTPPRRCGSRLRALPSAWREAPSRGFCPAASPWRRDCFPTPWCARRPWAPASP